MQSDCWVISEPGLEQGSPGLCLVLLSFESTNAPVCSGLDSGHTEEVSIDEHRWTMGEKLGFHTDDTGV